MDAVKPIFAELSSPKLLKKCLGGKTQNSNESFNSTSDNARIKEAEMKSRSSTLDARRAMRMRKKAMHEHFVEIEGVTNEAHFWLDGYVNKQNCRIWSEANPQVYVETPLHSEKLTVWCALWAGGIIGPYFFKNDEGHNVTVNGDRYRAMITNFFIPELNNHNVQELWFQQDGATCHTARATIDLLKDTFGDRLI
ncbi:DUF4817 domain-containing protein [Trichonephila clavipes]|uniref:DUF4817 domain-containing protein n=1 Tax=Trichonephila clavipes TaxID=2585209 RepID=A0A8X6RM90_TRICX|nr:DUF4817 domain-containing protein [Trichonephila clavipes]